MKLKYLISLLTLGMASLLSPNTASAAIRDNFFSTNRYPQLMPIRVSSMGIANGTSTNRNAGADFGPDTPGTTTSGIQEALNSIPIGTNQGPYMAPITIQLDPGDFFYTNVIYYSNSYTAGIEIAGAGMLNTTLIYAGGTVSNTISITGGSHTGGLLNLPFHVTVRDATMTALVQRTNVLLYVGKSSYTRIANMNFTGWNVRTNNDSGAAVSMVPDVATFPPGLVGLRINNSLDHSTVIDNIFFAGLAVGAHIKSDHPSARDLKFSMISFGSYGSTNIWPTNSIYNIGAGIILEGNAYDSRWDYGHAYAMRCGFAAVGCSVSPTLNNWHFESANYPVVSDTELVPVLIDPVSTAGSFSDFNQYILFTPTSANYPSNHYALSVIDHPFGYQRMTGRYDSADYSFAVRRANSLKMYVDGSADYVVADGEGIFDIRAVGIHDLGADPNADRGVFWDDSAGALKYFTFGSGLTMTDTTLTAAGGATTITNYNGAAGLVTGGSGSYGIGTNVVATDGFWTEDIGAAGGYTNLYAARWITSGGDPVLYMGDENTSFGNSATHVSKFGPFYTSTTGAEDYWIGKISGGVSEGDANLNNVTVNSLDVNNNVDVTGNVLAGGIYRAGAGFTNRAAVWGSNGNLTNGAAGSSSTGTAIQKGDGSGGFSAATFTDVQSLAPSIIMTNNISVAMTFGTTVTVDGGGKFYTAAGSPSKEVLSGPRWSLASDGTAGNLTLLNNSASSDASFQSRGSILDARLYTNQAPALTIAGAMLWSDGTNLCVILQNGGGVRTTNKVTLSAYP